MGRALIAACRRRAQRLLSYIKRQEGKNWPKVKANIERAIKDYEKRGRAPQFERETREPAAAISAATARDVRVHLRRRPRFS